MSGKTVSVASVGVMEESMAAVTVTIPEDQFVSVELQPPFHPIPDEGAFCWHVVLPSELHASGDDNDHSTQSQWRLWEDGSAIGQPHAAHKRIGNVGQGLYSHWLSGLYFSTSDNSDPNVNGRKYELRPVVSKLEADAADSAPSASGGPAVVPRGDDGLRAIVQPSPPTLALSTPSLVREFDLGDGSVQTFDLGQLPYICTSLDYLVFRTRELRWEDVIPDFATRSTLLSSIPVLQSFASPGQAAVETASPVVSYEGISFPGEGAYNVLTQFGVFRFLILPPEPSAADVISIGRFFSANVVHSGTDVGFCSYGRKIASTIYYPNLFHKLFRSDQPLGLICGQASMALCALYRTAGFESRQVHFELRGHFSTEVHDGKRWVLVDPDFDCVVRDASGELVDADVIGRALLLDEDKGLRVESLSGKQWLKGELGFLWGFYGHRSWHPEDTNSSRCCDSFLSQLRGSLIRRRTAAYDGGVLSMVWTKTSVSEVDEPNTYIPISEQIDWQRTRIAGNQQYRALYDAAISKLDLAANQKLIYRHGATSGFDGPLKYLDCAYWLRQKLEIVLQLDLHKASPQRILDIGTGGGHFPSLCVLLGHEVIGVDIDVEVYQDICHLLGINRQTLRIERGQRLPDFGGKFRLITAFASQFDYISSNEFWSKQEWREFLEDLILNQVEAPGRIYFSLNTAWDAETATWKFKDRVGEVFREFGGTVDPSRSVVDLHVSEELVQSLRAGR